MTLDEILAEKVEGAVRAALLRMPEELADQLLNRPIVLTKREAGELLNCSVRQIEKWLAEGDLPRMPHTAKVLIPRIALEAFVESAAAPEQTAIVRRAS